jgi:hypothetical protein
MGSFPVGVVRIVARTVSVMKTYSSVAPRTATIVQDDVRREGRAVERRSGRGAAAAGIVLAIALAACSPGGSGTPLPVSSVAPLVNPSAVASAAAGLAMAALDQVDAAITANTSSAGLSTDDASSLTQLTAALRTALQTGDTAAAKTALDSLSTKVDGLAAKLNSATGQQLTTAVAALKAAMPTS